MSMPSESWFFSSLYFLALQMEYTFSFAKWDMAFATVSTYRASSFEGTSIIALGLYGFVSLSFPNASSVKNI